MSILDYLSDSIFSQESSTGFHFAGLIFLILTIRAIIQLNKTKLIKNRFYNAKTVGQLVLIGAWCYLTYFYVRKNKHSKDKKTLKNVVKLQYLFSCELESDKTRSAIQVRISLLQVYLISTFKICLNL